MSHKTWLNYNFRINPTLCQSAQAKAAQLASQTGGTCRIDHDVANLQSVNQGENLYSGTGTGCMAKTPAQHMEIGEFFEN